jgi:phage shock protein PspC (stress-responsive transcriptional regulator)
LGSLPLWGREGVTLTTTTKDFQATHKLRISTEPSFPLVLLVKKQYFSMKRLYRSKKERMLGGVCAGLGEHFDIDPTVIRLVWAVITVISIGTGVLVYFLAWILIPEEDTGSSASEVQKSEGLS